MTYEVEVKCLLGGSRKAKQLLALMKKLDPSSKQLDHKLLLNHYFNCDNLDQLKLAASKVLASPRLKKLNQVIDASGVVSVRTRQKNGQVLLIAKGVPAGGDVIHGSNRLEIEEPVDIPIEELDRALVEAGLTVLAKWSATKDSYQFIDVVVEIQFSPGYGYMVEIEKVVNTKPESITAEKRIHQVVKQLGLQEVDHDLISRMYDYYNAHWQQYYGSQKTFSAKVLKSLQ